MKYCLGLQSQPNFRVEWLWIYKVAGPSISYVVIVLCLTQTFSLYSTSCVSLLLMIVRASFAGFSFVLIYLFNFKFGVVLRLKYSFLGRNKTCGYLNSVLYCFKRHSNLTVNTLFFCYFIIMVCQVFAFLIEMRGVFLVREASLQEPRFFIMSFLKVAFSGGRLPDQRSCV